MDIIKEDVFRKEIKKGLSGGYLFFGEEDYLKSFCLRAVKEAVCPDETFAVFNEVNIDALDYSAGALANALMPPPMMADQKLVTVSGLAISELKQSELAELYDVLEGLKDYDYNVLIISVPAGLIDEGTQKKPGAALSELSKYLTPVRFDSISGAKLVGWVAKHFEHNGVSASPEVCSHLIDRCGRAMFALAAETEKISYYALAHGRTTVTVEDVDNISPAALDSDAYAFTNAILDGRYADAINALNVMKFNRVDPIFILPEVSRAVCDMIAIKALQKDNVPVGEIARILKMNEYRVKIYAAATAQKTDEKLRRALMLCSEADLSLKLGSQGYGVIERLICSL